MASQTGKNFSVAFRQEVTAFNAAPSTVTSATQVRVVSGGLGLRKTIIQSNEARADGMTSQGRHGFRSVDGSYQCEISLGAHDALFEALMRSTWATGFACTTATASLTTVSTTSNTLVAATGNWYTAGVRVGDVFRCTGLADAGNNNKNLRVKALSTTVLTLHGTSVLVSNATPQTLFVVNVGRKLKRATTPTRRTLYIDQYNSDIDSSEVFGGCRVVSAKINGTPDGMATVEFGFLGASATPLASAASPFYSSYVTYTGQPMVFADATLSYNGVDVGFLTGFSMDIQLNAKTEPVVGSFVTPDIFDNELRISGSMSALRSDLQGLTDFAAETEFGLHILLVENEAEPKDYLAIYIPAVKLASADASFGGDGALTETRNWFAGMKEGAGAPPLGGYDDTLFNLITSQVGT